MNNAQKAIDLKFELTFQLLLYHLTVSHETNSHQNAIHRLMFAPLVCYSNSLFLHHVYRLDPIFK